MDQVYPAPPPVPDIIAKVQVIMILLDYSNQLLNGFPFPVLPFFSFYLPYSSRQNYLPKNI